MGRFDGSGHSRKHKIVKKLKILISAYACEPDKGSEAGVGWNWAKQIARFHEVWVITRANNRGVIEKELKENPEPDLKFIYYDVPKSISFWKKKARGLYAYYLFWQIGIYRIARRLNKSEKFDLTHHLTFGNFWLPTFLSFLPTPFVWGPVGGGESVPKQFRKSLSIGGRVQEFFKDVILVTLKVNPLFLFNCNKSKKIIARTQETYNKIPLSFKPKTVKMIETGIKPNELFCKQNHPKEDVLQIISVGRLVHVKGFDLAIKAFAEASKKRSDMKMVIVGDGPERKRLHSICKEENVAHLISFTGHLDHEETLQYMSKSAIFLFPSLKEAGAWVLFEAMLLGLPTVVMDIAGPAEIVHDGCGIKVKPVTPEQTIQELSNALLTLANNQGLREKMGEVGEQTAKQFFGWDKKGEFINNLYTEVISNA